MIEFLGLIGMFTAAFLAALLGASFAWATLQVRAVRAGVPLEASPGREEPAALFKKEEDISTITVWGKLLMRVSQIDTLRLRISEADLKWSAGRATAAMLLLFSLTLVCVLKVEFLPPVIMFVLPAVAAGMPYFYILHRRNRRFAAFANQFPEALDSLARALKAGYPLSAAVELLSQEQAEPLASEMRRTRDEWRLGVSWDQALDSLADRVPLAEVRLFVAAVKMQNRMGGRLNDVLSRLSETMRDGAALDSEVRSISSHSRITGMVLTTMPIAICVLMLAVNPEYISVLFTTPEGRTMLSLAVLANVAAHLIVRKIVQIRS